MATQSPSLRCAAIGPLHTRYNPGWLLSPQLASCIPGLSSRTLHPKSILHPLSLRILHLTSRKKGEAGHVVAAVAAEYGREPLPQAPSI